MSPRASPPATSSLRGRWLLLARTARFRGDDSECSLEHKTDVKAPEGSFLFSPVRDSCLLRPLYTTICL